MGLFGFLRGKDEKAIPEPGTPEWDAAVSGTALPGSVEMGESGWANTNAAEVASRFGIDPAQLEQADTRTVDLRGTGAREDVEKVLREHGIDPDEGGPADRCL